VPRVGWDGGPTGRLGNMVRHGAAGGAPTTLAPAPSSALSVAGVAGASVRSPGRKSSLVRVCLVRPSAELHTAMGGRRPTAHTGSPLLDLAQFTVLECRTWPSPTSQLAAHRRHRWTGGSGLDCLVDRPPALALLSAARWPIV